MAFAALTIDLNARMANLEAGLARTESQLKGFADRAGAIAGSLSTAFATVGAGLVVSGIVAKLGQAISEMDALDEAAEKTGSSVEELSSIFNTLAPVGVTMESLTDIAGKLVRSMQQAEDAGSAQAKAFAALGVATKDAQGNLRSSVAVLDDIAKALSTYENGANKTALAQIFFGKTGQDLIPILNDLVSRKREDATVTTEAAAEAAKLADNWGTLKREGDRLAQSIAQSIVPALAGLITRFNESRQAGLGFWRSLQSGLIGDQPDAVKDILGIEVKKLADLRKQQQKYEQDIIRGATTFEVSMAKRQLPGITQQVAEAEKVVNNLLRQAEKLGVAERRIEGSDLTRFLKSDTYGPRPDAPRIDDTPEKDKKVAQARQSEAERLLQNLYEQLDTTAKLSEEQRLLSKIERGSIEGITPLLRERLLVTAKIIDEERRRQKVLEEGTRAEIEDNERTAELGRQSARDLQAEVQAITKSVESPLEGIYRSMERIRELGRAGLLPPEVANAALAKNLQLVEAQFAGQVEKIKEVDDATKQLGLTFSSAFEDAVIEAKSFQEILSAVAKDIARILIRQQITNPFVEWFTTGKTASGGGKGAATFFDMILGLFRADGGPVAANSPYIVGERGPELFVPQQSGMVVANGKFGSSGGTTIYQQFDLRNSAFTPQVIEQSAQLGAARALSTIREANARGSRAYA